jgi:hypothetical protein
MNTDRNTASRLNVIQPQLGDADLGVTSVYRQGD